VGTSQAVEVEVILPEPEEQVAEELEAQVQELQEQ
jgi:hypothetical protein